MEINYKLLTEFIEKSIENTFWIYYKYFDENTKIKFEEYLKNKGINPKEIYQKRIENYPETEREFPRDLNKGRCYFIKKAKQNESFLHLTNIKI